MNIGILGGGQLGQMLALAGIPLGLHIYFYHPQQSTVGMTPLGLHCEGEYDDRIKLKEFANHVDVITFENEMIPVATIEYLETLKPIYPDKQALLIARDRLCEKKFFTELDIPTNGFLEVDSREDLLQAIERWGYPIILKKRTHGYDGKGQVKIEHPDQLDKMSKEQYTNTLAEEFVSFEREVSFIASQNRDQEWVFYDLCENIHKKGILFHTQNKRNDPLLMQAKQYVHKMMTHLNYVGTLAVEFFQVGQQLIANEIAPRVHNSGHWTIEGSYTSQFENHLRSIVNWSLGDTQSIMQSSMYNILGNMPDKKELLQIPGLKLHDYEKSPAPNRKLGHVNLLNITNRPRCEIEALERLLNMGS